MPKESDLSIYSQDELDAITLSLNIQPRQTIRWKSLLATYPEHMARLRLMPDSVHETGVAVGTWDRFLIYKL